MGRQGVSKTLSARRYSRWDYLQGIDPYTVPDKDLGSLKGAGTVFYTTGVINSPGQISSDIYRLRSRLQSLAREPLRREAAYKLKQIDIRDAKYVEEIFVTHDWLAGPAPKLKPTYAAISQKYIAKEKRIGDPARLILVDEADRLKMVSVTLRIIWHRILPAIWHRERFAKAPWTNWHHWINLMLRAL